jgi:hypothetical protein
VLREIAKNVIIIVISIFIFSYLTDTPISLLKDKTIEKFNTLNFNMFQELKSPAKTNKSLRRFEKSALDVCKINTKEIVEEERVKSTTDFSYRLLHTKEFTNIREAEKYGNEWTTFGKPSICKDDIEKIIVAVYEYRYEKPYVVPILDYPINKQTMAFYCDEKGVVLTTALFC